MRFTYSLPSTLYSMVKHINKYIIIQNSQAQTLSLEKNKFLQKMKSPNKYLFINIRIYYYNYRSRNKIMKKPHSQFDILKSHTEIKIVKKSLK